MGLLFDAFYFSDIGKRRMYFDPLMSEDYIIKVSRDRPNDFVRADCKNGDPRDIRWYRAGDRVGTPEWAK